MTNSWPKAAFISSFMIILIKPLQFVFWLIFFLPAPLAVYLMRLAGETIYRIARLTKIKSQVASNIKLLFPAADTKLLADKLLRNVGYAVFEIICAPYFRPAHISLTTKVNNVNNLKAALAQGKGVLCLIMHTGNYELSTVALAPYDLPLNVTLKASDDPLTRIVNQARAHQGTKLINVLEQDMYKASLAALARNEIVSVLIDTGALEGRHELLPFLGRKVPVATGWLTLAQRSGAAIVPTYSCRVKDNVELTIGDILHITAQNREEVKTKIGKFYEDFISQHPEQWAIFLNEYEVKRMVNGQ